MIADVNGEFGWVDFSSLEYRFREEGNLQSTKISIYAARHIVIPPARAEGKTAKMRTAAVFILCFAVASCRFRGESLN